MTNNYPWYSSYPSHVPHEINPDEYTSLQAILDEVASKYPNRTGWANMGTKISFSQMARSSKAFAGYLQSLPDMRPGDRVAIMMPNLLQYIVVLFGCLRAGFVVVNINPLYTAREVHHTLQDSGAKVLVAIENFGTTVQQALPDTNCKHVVMTAVGDLFPFMKRHLINFIIRKVKKMVPAYQIPHAISFNEALSIGENHGFTPHETQSSDLAFLQYTGGTTGVSKGAMLTHRNLLANIAQVGTWIANDMRPGKEVVMTALPLYHIFSLTATFVFMKLASTSVLITNPRDIGNLAKEFQKWKFSVVIGVNTLYAAMLNHPAFAALNFSSVRLSVAGGTQVQKVIAERWKQLTNSNILEAYGLTECSPGVCGNIPNALWDGSVGCPVSSTIVSIRNDSFEDLGYCPEGADPTNYTGEICVQGPQVMKGYWNRPEETANVMRDGWLRTGDVGHIDHRGVLFITDRKKDMILVSGFNVYPNEIENIIAAMPGVLEVGVVGVPSEKSGETVKAVIVRKDPNLTVDDVKKYCRSQLTGYKMPKQIVFVDHLPKTPVGKILRRELKNL